MRIPQPGEAFEQSYLIGEPLGQGAFGIVFRAEDVVGGRTVAIKILEPHPGGYPERVAERFRREVQALAEVQHPHVVDLYDFGQTADGLLYMVMEFVGGGELGVLRDGRPVETVQRVLEQILSALDEMHRRGFVHRDIKPSNILLVDDTPCIKLVDFGIAKLAEPVDGKPGLTTRGGVLGTPAYMAPEQMMAERVTEASDLYSAGLVVIELLLGSEFARSWHRGAAVQALKTEAPSSNTLPADCGPRPLRQTLERMTHGDPDQRIRRASLALEMLRATTSESPQLARTHARPSADVDLDDATTRADPVRRNNNQRKALFLVVLGIVLGVAIATVLTDEEPAPGSAPASGARDTPLVRAPRATPPREAKTPSRTEDTARLSRPKHASPGCGNPPTFTGMGAVGENFGSARWRTLVPTNYEPEHLHPVVAVFHADLFSGELMIDDLGLEKLANREKLIVIAPDFDTVPATKRRMQHARIPDAIAAAGRQFCLDGSRIYLLAFGLGTDGATRMSCEPWVTAVVAGGFLPIRHLLDEVTDQGHPAYGCAVPQLHYGMLEAAPYPAEGGRSCAILNFRSRASLDEYESRLRQRNGCEEGTEQRVHSVGRDVCTQWSCTQRYVSCHLRGGLFWPGSGQHRWPVQNIHGCELDPTISEFPGTEYAWAFLESVEPNPPDQTFPW